MMIYKVLRAAEWRQFQDQGQTAGAPVDLTDGYIHFSTAETLAGTLEKHFSDEDGLTLLACDPDALGEALHWEPSRGGLLFPIFTASCGWRRWRGRAPCPGPPTASRPEI